MHPSKKNYNQQDKHKPYWIKKTKKVISFKLRLCLRNINSELIKTRYMNSKLLYASLSNLTALLWSLFDLDSAIFDTMQFLCTSINWDCPFTIHGIQVPLYVPVHHSAVTLSPSRANTRATWGSSSLYCWRPRATNSSGWILESAGLFPTSVA